MLLYEKAIQTDPKNPDYQLDYAMLFSHSDTATFHSLVLGLLKRFPDNKQSAQALYWMTYYEKNCKAKCTYFEIIKDNYSRHKFSWYNVAMNDYFSYTLFTNPTKAAEIARIMQLPAHENLADTILKVYKLMEQKRFNTAYAIIKPLLMINVNAEDNLKLLKAQVADSANDTKGAFDTIAKYYCKQPSYILQRKMFQYGSKLGLTYSNIQDNVKKLRISASQQATEFNLFNYLNQKRESLSDYKGKVILLTYWYPGCGPCRDEFLHFEKIIQLFNTNEVAYIGINVNPSQDKDVIPFLKSTGCSFIPLRDSLKRNKGNLEANGTPANYLLDQNGRIIFSNFHINGDNEEMLELMIRDLLESGEYDPNCLVDSVVVK